MAVVSRVDNSWSRHMTNAVGATLNPRNKQAKHIFRNYFLFYFKLSGSLFISTTNFMDLFGHFQVVILTPFIESTSLYAGAM